MPHAEPTRDDIRRAMLKAMTGQNAPNQYGGLERAAAAELARQGFTAGVREGEGLGASLEGLASRRFREVVWDLISTGFLVPGSDSNNPEWPFLSLTEEGRRLAEAEGPTPTDPEGFSSHVAELLPQGDDRVFVYLREAIGAFNRQLYVAATVMLGTAAEGLVLLLAEAIAASKGADGPEWLRVKIENRFALARLRAVGDELTAVSGDLPRRLREGFEAYWGSIHGLLRMERNEAGHPTGVQRQRNEVLPAILLFPVLVRLVADLIHWFGERGA